MPPGPKPRLFSVEKDGNRNHRRKQKSVQVSGDFEPPFLLGEIAMQEWNRIRSEAPWIQAPAASLLAMRCAAFERLAASREDIERRGTLIETRNGAVTNPSLRIEREDRNFVLRADIELGLTPYQQTKMGGLAQTKEVDPLEAALCG